MTSVAVIGAGAAGLVAAIVAASRGADVVLLERTPDGGRKILISGGGRCNVLPSVLAPERFVTDSPPHLMRGMLKAWPLHEQRAFFENDLDIPLALEEESGKLFPKSNRARDVRDGLVALARQRGVRLQFGTSVTALERGVEGFTIETSAGPIAAARVVLATGGLSVPATGSDGTGLAIAAALGHRMVDTYPALTPLLGSAASGHAALSGVSLTVHLRGKAGSRTIDTHGGFLFTHRGYSGPSVLDISHLVTRPSAVAADDVASGFSRTIRAADDVASGDVASGDVASGFLTAEASAKAVSRTIRAADDVASGDVAAGDVASGFLTAEASAKAVSRTIRAQWSALDPAAWNREFAAPSALVSTLLARHVPSRLGDRLMIEAGVPLERRTSNLRRTERLSLVGRLTSYVLPWTGDEGYKKAEVTGGGVALDQVDPRTLESRRCPGLYLCGEILDVFGPIGGHNFAWAWATGRAAGLAAGDIHS